MRHEAPSHNRHSHTLQIKTVAPAPENKTFLFLKILYEYSKKRIL